MTHYEQRLAADLQKIRERVVTMARYAERAFADATSAMLHDDDELAYATILGDHRLNRDSHDLDALCHAFIARHLPSAGHLRFVSSVLRMNIAIERIGDYAVTIGRESAQLNKRPTDEIRRDLHAMAEQSRGMLSRATDAFEQRDADLARATIATAADVDLSFDNVFADLLEAGDADALPLVDLFALLITFNRVERVSDQAKNLCEEVIFVETGKTKPAKVYPIAFVDERNDCLSIMAQAIAEKAYPNGGRYLSAGWSPADSLDPGFDAFMDQRGHSTDDLKPGSVTRRLGTLQDLHVVVGIGADPRPHLPPIPYHVVVQIWDLEAPAEGLDRERTDAMLDDRYRQLAARIEDLMETLHGEAVD